MALEGKVAMITGDARNVANAVAAELGIDEVFAEVLPEHKAEAVKDLQRPRKRAKLVKAGQELFVKKRGA